MYPGVPIDFVPEKDREKERQIRSVWVKRVTNEKMHELTNKGVSLFPSSKTSLKEDVVGKTNQLPTESGVFEVSITCSTPEEYKKVLGLLKKDYQDTQIAADNALKIINVRINGSSQKSVSKQLEKDLTGMFGKDVIMEGWSGGRPAPAAAPQVSGSDVAGLAAARQKATEITLNPDYDREVFIDSDEIDGNRIVYKKIGTGLNKPIHVYINDSPWEIFADIKKAKKEIKIYIDSDFFKADQAKFKKEGSPIVDDFTVADIVKTLPKQPATPNSPATPKKNPEKKEPEKKKPLKEDVERRIALKTGNIRIGFDKRISLGFNAELVQQEFGGKLTWFVVVHFETNPSTGNFTLSVLDDVGIIQLTNAVDKALGVHLLTAYVYSLSDDKNAYFIPRKSALSSILDKNLLEWVDKTKTSEIMQDSVITSQDLWSLVNPEKKSALRDIRDMELVFSKYGKPINTTAEAISALELFNLR